MIYHVYHVQLTIMMFQHYELSHGCGENRASTLHASSAQESILKDVEATPSSRSGSKTPGGRGAVGGHQAVR